jgi:hypothetical protein
MDGKFSISFDGQEAQMIIDALLEKVEQQQTPQAAEMYRTLAGRVAARKSAFHASSYQIMAARYGLPNMKAGDYAIQVAQR